MVTDVIDVEVEEERVVSEYCSDCDVEFKNERGLAIHMGRIHKGSTKTKPSAKPRAKKAGKNVVTSNGNGSSRATGVAITPSQLTIVSGRRKHKFDIEPDVLMNVVASSKKAAQQYLDSI